MRVLVHNMGCKVNLADAAEIVDRLPAGDWRVVNSAARADVVLLNTCTVTHKADRDVRKFLGSLRTRHPRLRVVATGCGVATQDAVLAGFENVDARIPPGDPEAVAAALHRAAGRPRPAPGPRHHDAFTRLGRTRAFLKVQDGCNARCSYCILPTTRGAERSVASAEVLRQVQRLSDAGYAEIVLCGIHLGRYTDPSSASSGLAALVELLAPLCAGVGARLRLSSIEPMEWTPALIGALERNPCVCRHFHVPLQSGDDSVLRRMGRPYRAEQVRRVIEMLRARFPDAALGTDVLVGFPGESNRAAGNTRGLVRDLPLDYLHVFTFSARPGTPAADLPDRPAAEEARLRSAALREIGAERWRAFLSKGIDRSHRVLVERSSGGWAEGHTSRYRRLKVSPAHSRAGELVEAWAHRLEGDILVGVPLGATAPENT